MPRRPEEWVGRYVRLGRLTLYVKAYDGRFHYVLVFPKALLL